jgi:hypothetical protein
VITYIATFLPWIAFAALSGVSWFWAAVAGLVVAASVVGQQVRSGAKPDALILQYSTTTYFVILCVLGLVAPHSGVENYAGAASFGWLAVISWITLAIRRPFTTGIAKQTTPEEYWDLPVFHTVNVVITSVWATCFTLVAIALAVVDAGTDSGGLKITIQVLGFVIPAVFTARHPRTARARAVRATS